MFGAKDTAIALERLETRIRQLEQRLAERLEACSAVEAERAAAIELRLRQSLSELASGGRGVTAPEIEAIIRDLADRKQPSETARFASMEEAIERLSSELDGLTRSVRRLHADVASGFGQVAQRLEGDLVTLATRTDELSGAIGTGLASSGERLAAGLASLGALAERLEAAVAEIGRRPVEDLPMHVASDSDRPAAAAGAVGPRLERVAAGLAGLSQFVQRLDRDVGQGLAQIGQRLEADLATLAGASQSLSSTVNVGFGQVSEALALALGQVSERLDRDLGSLSDYVQRLDRNIGEGFAKSSDALAAAFAQPAERLTRDLAGLSSYVQRLDRDVGQGFAQIGQNGQELSAAVSTGFARSAEQVGGDLRILADQIAQLSTNVAEASTQTRLNSGVLSKLTLDAMGFPKQAELPEAAGSGNPEPASAYPFVAAEVRSEVLLDQPEAGLPDPVRAALRDEAAGDRPVRWLPSSGMPRTADTLPAIVATFRAARRQLRPGERIGWVQPPQLCALFGRDETEQALGLLGAVTAIEEVDGPEGRWRIAVAEARTEAFAFALRWSVGALDAAHLSAGPLFSEALGRLGLRDALHGVEMPAPDLDFAYWAHLVESLLEVIGEAPEAALGLVLRPDFNDHIGHADRAAEHLARLLQARNGRPGIAFQWVAGALNGGLSPAIVDFAARHGSAFDLSPVDRNSHESKLAAYDDLAAYRPLPFDIRLPSFAPKQAGPIEIPRRSGRDVMLAQARGEPAATLGGEFDRDFEQSCRRLALALDRRAQAEFEKLSNLDPGLIPGLWPEYFVYNWAPPAAARLRLFEFEAGEILSGDSPLARLHRSGALSQADSRRQSARAFLQTAKCLADAPQVAVPALREVQIDAHEYLRDRLDITPDAERLIGWMPRGLGATLELGSGFGVMARRVGERADIYVGLDLTVEQAGALRPLGALGFVADIHLLPFADEQFDTIIADNVVEHAYDPLQVLSEIRRVLRPKGEAFLIIPPDYLGPAFRNRSHFWKSDADSVRRAAEAAGLSVARWETVRMAELGASGAHPSSDGLTTLWQLKKPAQARPPRRA